MPATAPMVQRLHFRPATPADRDAVIALVTSAYRGEASRAGWTTEADLLDGPRIVPEVLDQELARPRSLVLLAEHGEPPDATAAAPHGEPPDATAPPGAAEPPRRLVACAQVCDEAGVGQFGMFAVAPTRQGAGIGDAVLRECERIARDDWGLPRMRMAVIDRREELIAWYGRRGYRRTGESRPFPYGDARFGRPKCDDLRFAVLEKALATAANPSPQDGGSAR
jgi:ribosomal protein S18 acetylase RimI-like enzyme